MEFKDYLLNESKHYLGQKIGDLLGAIQELAEDAPNMGNRPLIRAMQDLVNQIRKLLHGRWEPEDLKYLKVLQKAGVALCKGIDEKEELDVVIASVAAEIEEMSADMEVPVNSVASDENTDEEEISGNMDIGA